MTNDFRLYHELIPFFAAAGLPVQVIAPDDPIAPNIQVVLNGPQNDSRTIKVVHLETTLVRALLALQPNGKVVIGIDPGQVIGLALLRADRVLRVHQAHSINEALTHMALWKEATIATVHIGDGDPATGQPLLAGASQLFPGRAFIVSEERTSPAAPATGSRHTDAACYIAMRKHD